jgi:hypothetical protein
MASFGQAESAASSVFSGEQSKQQPNVAALEHVKPSEHATQQFVPMQVSSVIAFNLHIAFTSIAVGVN